MTRTLDHQELIDIFDAIIAAGEGEALRDFFEQGLDENLGYALPDPDDPGFADGLLKALLDCSTEEFSLLDGLATGQGNIYPLAGYGWDGGNGINTTTFNLLTGCETDVFSGPFASLCRRKNPAIAGLVLHFYHGERNYILQVCGERLGELSDPE